jgi:hypothetical protein
VPRATRPLGLPGEQAAHLQGPSGGRTAEASSGHPNPQTRAFRKLNREVGAVTPRMPYSPPLFRISLIESPFVATRNAFVEQHQVTYVLAATFNERRLILPSNGAVFGGVPTRKKAFNEVFLSML